MLGPKGCRFRDAQGRRWKTPCWWGAAPGGRGCRFEALYLLTRLAFDGKGGRRRGNGTPPPLPTILPSGIRHPHLRAFAPFPLGIRKRHSPSPYAAECRELVGYPWARTVEEGRDE